MRYVIVENDMRIDSTRANYPPALWSTESHKSGKLWRTHAHNTGRGPSGRGHRDRLSGAGGWAGRAGRAWTVVSRRAGRQGGNLPTEQPNSGQAAVAAFYSANRSTTSISAPRASRTIGEWGIEAHAVIILPRSSHIRSSSVQDKPTLGYPSLRANQAQAEERSLTDLSVLKRCISEARQESSRSSENF